MALTPKQQNAVISLCNKYFNITEPDFGCTPCPLKNTCDAFSADYSEESYANRTAEFEAQLQSLIDTIDLSAHGILAETDEPCAD